jgi:S1-C subfamily serine protease
MAVRVTCICGKSVLVRAAESAPSVLCPGCGRVLPLSFGAPRRREEPKSANRRGGPPPLPTARVAQPPPLPRGLSTTSSPPRSVGATPGAMTALMSSLPARMVLVALSLMLSMALGAYFVVTSQRSRTTQAVSHVTDAQVSMPEIPVAGEPLPARDAIKESAAPQKPVPSPAENQNSRSLTTDQVVKKTEASVALVKGSHGSGSGFLVGPGLVATNSHVIRTETLQELEVYFPSAAEGSRGPSRASLAYENPRRDLAMLKVSTGLPFLDLARGYQFKRGEEITIIGNPGVKFIGTVIPNAVSRGIFSTEVTWKGFRYYQLGASVNHGNSGGPVLDSFGKVVGVVTLKAQEEAIGFCIPSSDLDSALAEFRAASPEDVKKANRKHDVVAAVCILRQISTLYCHGLEAYLAQMDGSLRRGGTVNDGLRAVAIAIARALHDADLDVSEDLKAQLSRMVQDETLTIETRGNLRELWSAYSDMKSYVEEPRGTFESFRTKYLQLKDQYNHAIKGLELGLDIEPDD